MSEVTLNFTREEYAARLAKTRAAMANAGVELLIVSDPSNMAWLTGYDGWSFYVHQCVLVPPEGDPLWYGRGQDANGAKLTCYLAPDRIIGYADHYVQSTERHPMDFLSHVIAERGWDKCAIGVENVWNRFMLSPREAAQLVDEVGSQWVGIYLDTANMMAYGYPEQWIKALGGRIKKVHFKDFARRDHKFTDLLDGDTDWPAVVGELRAIGYDDAVIHEVGGDFDAQVETAKRMRQIVAM